MTSQDKVNPTPNRPGPLPPNQHRAPTHAPDPCTAQLAGNQNPNPGPAKPIHKPTTQYCCSPLALTYQYNRLLEKNNKLIVSSVSQGIVLC